MNNLLLQPSRANEYEVIDGDWIVATLCCSALRWPKQYGCGRWITPSIKAAIRRTASRPREMLPCRRSREAGSARTNRESPVAD
jgi:hypothetical protein